ncbi:MAG: acyltransferase family protein [Bacteroidales bacterium]
MNNRDPFFDLLKGLAIIGVIAIHTFPGVDSNTLEKILRLLMNISVPIFLMISGYFLGKKDLSAKDKYINFEKKQIKKIYPLAELI